MVSRFAGVVRFVRDRAVVPGRVKHRVAQAADTQDRYLSGIRPVRFMAICSESVHPLAIME